MASNGWIFDSVLSFLSSPLWNEPVRNFIERNCTVFDPGEENKFSYTDIHKEYKALIETLLTSFLDDLGVKITDFESACDSSPEAAKAAQEPEQGLLKHIFAADDFLLFKQMMVAKNTELDLQALQLVQQWQQQLQASKQTNGVKEAATTAQTAGSAVTEYTNTNDDEDKLLEEILKQSKDEYMASLRETETTEQKELERVQKLSEEDFRRQCVAIQLELDQLAMVLQLSLREHEEKLKMQVLERTGATSGDLQKQSVKETSSKTSGSNTDKHAADQGDDFWARAARAPITSSSITSRGYGAGKEPTPEELQQRQEYLRQQRDRLLRLKEVQRKKRLQDFIGTPKAAKQPNLARAAQAVIDGSEQPESRDISDEEKLKLRFALAARLKREVIDAHKNPE